MVGYTKRVPNQESRETILVPFKHYYLERGNIEVFVFSGVHRELNLILKEIRIITDKIKERLMINIFLTFSETSKLFIYVFLAAKKHSDE